MGRTDRAGRRGGTEEPAPKPFSFVPIAGQVRRSVPPGHHIISGGIIEEMLPMKLVFEGEVLQPIHIGSGLPEIGKVEQKNEIIAMNVETKKLEDGRLKRYLTIPGTSLKGAIRSIVEAITDSCVCIAGSDTRRALRGGGVCSDVDELCPACSLFGARSYGGRVSFTDTLIPMEAKISLVRTPNLWQPAKGHRIPRCYLINGNPGRKFYYHRRPATEGKILKEIIKRGTRVEVILDLIPATMAEAGAILCAMGCNPRYSFPIKIGGGKPVGLGSIKFSLREAVLYGEDSGRSLRGRLGGDYRKLSGVELNAWASTAIGRALPSRDDDKAEALVDENRLKMLAQIYAREGMNEEAPSGIY